ncbi:MAG: M15 family metallopeptidase [Herbiconiux sp.]|nr:M15 family metallopeptidase [Herbiconiux sp.]
MPLPSRRLRPLRRHGRIRRLRPLGPGLATAALLLTLTGCATGSGATGIDHGAADPLAPSVAGDHPAGAFLGPDDGVIPEGQWVSLGDDLAAMTRLDPALRDALEAAQDAALADGADPFLFVDGWRSTAYQQQLFDQAVQRYGSVEEAARWVKRGDASKHVTGEAVDLATAGAMDWLNRFGGPFGLCQVYTNEAWHFELTADEQGTCPAQLPDGSAG